MDLPEPGGPIIRRWCPPAAATSSARLLATWPITSARSGKSGARETSDAVFSAAQSGGGVAMAGGGRGARGAVRGQLSACDQDAERDRQVEMARCLGQVGRCEIDGDAARGKFEMRVLDRGAHARTALADLGVGGSDARR